MQYEQKKINVDCIIPAAGLSSRMGEWKLTLPFNNSTIVEESIKNALAVCSRVILVVGYRSDELIERIKTYPNVEVVINPDYEQGMYSSIRKGVELVRSDYFFVTHADMPCISRDVFELLWNNRAEGSVFPGSESHSGHPVLISSSLKAVIESATQQPSMKSVLKQFPMSFLGLSHSNIHLDVDTPTAYQNLINQSSA